MFVRGANPIWSFVDLIGHQLDDTYYISFLSNTFPYLPQAVYHDNQGLIPWSQPIQFLANGTLDPDIFGNPNSVYRLEVRQGATQFDPLIYVVNNYIFEAGSSIITLDDKDEENQVSNPQFSVVNFLNSFGNTQAPNPQIALNTAGTYEIAPGWSIVLTGVGTTKITQFITDGAQNSPSNVVPPYYLEIDTNGWTSAILQQTLSGVGAIWYNNYVAVSILVKSNDSIAHPISVNYVPNLPGVPVELIASVPVSTSTFEVIKGIAALFPPDNTDSINTTPNNSAFVNIQIVLPTTGVIDISNIQLFSIENQSQAIITDFSIIPDETLERQKDHLAHYYDPKLAFKPIPSWLLAWDFPLNPAQDGETYAAPAIGANKSQYTWDGTIIFQSANSGIAVSRGTQMGLKLAATATSQAAVIQYIQQTTARKILKNNLAVNLVALTGTSTISGTISLWYNKEVVPTVTAGTNNSIVATLDANGKPATFNGTWTEVPLKIGQEATFTLTTTRTEFDFPFWQSPSEAEIALAQNIAIVVGFQSIPLGTINPEIISVSLNSGDISTIPPAETQDEVLRKCQYWYERSYDPGVGLGAVTNIGAQFFNGYLFHNVGVTFTLYPNEMNLTYKQEKRVIPQITVWSVAGTQDQITGGIRIGTAYPAPTSGLNPRNVTITVWNIGATQISTSNAVFSVNTATGADAILTINTASVVAIGEHIFHYRLEARPGIV